MQYQTKSDEETDEGGVYSQSDRESEVEYNPEPGSSGPSKPRRRSRSPAFPEYDFLDDYGSHDYSQSSSDNRSVHIRSGQTLGTSHHTRTRPPRRIMVHRYNHRPRGYSSYFDQPQRSYYNGQLAPVPYDPYNLAVGTAGRSYMESPLYLPVPPLQDSHQLAHPRPFVPLDIPYDKAPGTASKQHKAPPRAAGNQDTPGPAHFAANGPGGHPQASSPPPDKPTTGNSGSFSLGNAHTVIWDLSSTQDVTVHLKLDVEVDIEANIEEFLRLKRIGDYKRAENYFEENLSSHSEQPSVMVEYVRMLFDQGAYKRIDDLGIDEADISRTCLQLMGTKGAAEATQLLLLLHLVRSETDPNIAAACGAIQVALEFLQASLRNNPGVLDYSEVQVFYLYAWLSWGIDYESLHIVDGFTSHLVRAAWTRNLQLLYQNLLAEDRHWDMRDILISSTRFLGAEQTFLTIFPECSLAEGLLRLLADWSAMEPKDEPGFSHLALLDILNTLLKIKATFAPFGVISNEKVTRMVERASEEARAIAAYIKNNLPQLMKSQPYLTWVSVEERWARVRNDNGESPPETTSETAQPHRYLTSKFLTGFPGKVVMANNGGMVYIPAGKENPGWPVSPPNGSSVDSTLLTAVLKTAQEMENYRLQSECFNELICCSPDPDKYFTALEDLILNKQASPLLLLQTRLMRYLTTNDEKARKVLKSQLLELDPKLPIWRNFSHPLWEWAYRRILYALMSSLGEGHTEQATTVNTQAQILVPFLPPSVLRGEDAQPPYPAHQHYPVWQPAPAYGPYHNRFQPPAPWHPPPPAPPRAPAPPPPPPGTENPVSGFRYPGQHDWDDADQQDSASVTGQGRRANPKPYRNMSVVAHPRRPQVQEVQDEVFVARPKRDPDPVSEELKVTNRRAITERGRERDEKDRNRAELERKLAEEQEARVKRELEIKAQAAAEQAAQKEREYESRMRATAERAARMEREYELETQAAAERAAKMEKEVEMVRAAKIQLEAILQAEKTLQQKRDEEEARLRIQREEEERLRLRRAEEEMRDRITAEVQLKVNKELQEKAEMQEKVAKLVAEAKAVAIGEYEAELKAKEEQEMREAEIYVKAEASGRREILGELKTGVRWKTLRAMLGVPGPDNDVDISTKMIEDAPYHSDDSASTTKEVRRRPRLRRYSTSSGSEEEGKRRGWQSNRGRTRSTSSSSSWPRGEGGRTRQGHREVIIEEERRSRPSSRYRRGYDDSYSDGSDTEGVNRYRVEESDDESQVKQELWSSSMGKSKEDVHQYRVEDSENDTQGHIEDGVLDDEGDEDQEYSGDEARKGIKDDVPQEPRRGTLDKGKGKEVYPDMADDSESDMDEEQKQEFVDAKDTESGTESDEDSYFDLTLDEDTEAEPNTAAEKAEATDDSDEEIQVNWTQNAPGQVNSGTEENTGNKEEESEDEAQRGEEIDGSQSTGNEEDSDDIDMAAEDERTASDVSEGLDLYYD